MSGKAILLVEDDPNDAALTVHALEQRNADNKVVVARDGVEALDYLFGRGQYAGRDVEDLPQVVLLDLKMPRISGLEVLERIRAEERTDILPVVILTSSDEEQDMIKGYKLGANSYVLKPVNFEKFTDTVKELEQYWTDLNRFPSGKRAS